MKIITKIKDLEHWHIMNPETLNKIALEQLILRGFYCTPNKDYLLVTDKLAIIMTSKDLDNSK